MNVLAAAMLSHEATWAIGILQAAKPQSGASRPEKSVIVLTAWPPKADANSEGRWLLCAGVMPPDFGVPIWDPCIQFCNADLSCKMNITDHNEWSAALHVFF